MITEKDARAGAARDMGFLAELDFQIRDNHKLTSEVMRLDDENAKLRELVEDMLSCIEIQIAFDRTPEKWMYKEFAGRAQELGVEVNDA